ncbi:hypothetical protein V5799_032765 [Amblyomma americanum]|uniref:Uncharacterized protein n=1 Tax=Amblyomma americanum TaxID=6943 RepID=A0AAQ4DQ85_AMBAM
MWCTFTIQQCNVASDLRRRLPKTKTAPSHQHEGPQSARLVRRQHGDLLLSDRCRRFKGSSVPAPSCCRRGVWSCRHQRLQAVRRGRLECLPQTTAVSSSPGGSLKLARQDRGLNFPVHECAGTGFTALHPFGHVHGGMAGAAISAVHTTTPCVEQLQAVELANANNSGATRGPQDHTMAYPVMETMRQVLI